MLVVFFRFSVSAVTAVLGLVMKLILVAIFHSSVSIFAVVLVGLGFNYISAILLCSTVSAVSYPSFGLI